MQRDTVGTDLTGQDCSRAAHTNGHVRLECTLDLEPIRYDGLIIAGIDYGQVVQAVRCTSQVKGGDDLGAVHHLVNDRFVLGNAGPY